MPSDRESSVWSAVALLLGSSAAVLVLHAWWTL